MLVNQYRKFGPISFSSSRVSPFGERWPIWLQPVASVAKPIASVKLKQSHHKVQSENLTGKFKGQSAGGASNPAEGASQSVSIGASRLHLRSSSQSASVVRSQSASVGASKGQPAQVNLRLQANQSASVAQVNRLPVSASQSASVSASQSASAGVSQSASQ